MVKLTELEQAEAWVKKLNPHEKKRIFGGQEPNFDEWWPSLTTVDKLYEYNKWKRICPGTKAQTKIKPAPAKAKQEPKKAGKKKAPAKGKGKGKKK